jgi:hypothetical protein
MVCKVQTPRPQGSHSSAVAMMVVSNCPGPVLVMPNQPATRWYMGLYRRYYLNPFFAC